MKCNFLHKPGIFYDEENLVIFHTPVVSEAPPTLCQGCSVAGAVMPSPHCQGKGQRSTPGLVGGVLPSRPREIPCCPSVPIYAVELTHRSKYSK